MLNKEQLMQAVKYRQTQVHKVDVKDFGTVGLRVMTGTERELYEVTAFREGKFVMEDFRARLLCKCICDEQGNRIYSEDEIGIVGSFPNPVLIQLFGEAQRINALTPESIEELVKN